MAYRAAAVPFALGETVVGTSARPPAFFDFSIPIARADSWLTTSGDVVEACVASLMVKERRLTHLLQQTVSASVVGCSLGASCLDEAVAGIDGHLSALGALYPSYVFPLARGTDRIRLAIVNACCVVASKLLAYRTSYPTRLHELYAAVSEISIAYVALQATALSLGDRCAAAVAARHLRHFGQLLLTLHQLIPVEAVRELQQRGLHASIDELWEVAGVTGAV